MADNTVIAMTPQSIKLETTVYKKGVKRWNAQLQKASMLHYSVD